MPSAKKLVNVRLAPRMCEELRRVAAAEDESISSTIRKFIRIGLELEEHRAAARGDR